MNLSASQKITKGLGQSYTITVQTVDKSIYPGAGFYDLNKSFKSVSKVVKGGSMGIRPQLKQQSSTPSTVGPGVFRAKSTLKQCGATLSKVTSKDFDYKTPSVVGPGAYDRKTSLFQRGVTIPTVQRAQSASGQSPGPQSYRLEQYFDKQKKAENAHVFGSNRGLDINKNPGPSDYFKNRDVKGIAWKFNQHQQVQRENNNPGVGTYTLRGQPNQSGQISCKTRNYGLTY